MPLDTTTIPDRADRTNAKIVKYFNVTGPSSYVSGGESLNFGIGRPELVFFAGDPYNGTDLRVMRWNYSTSKMQWFDFAGAEIAGGTNLSAYSGRIGVYGV